MRIDLTGVCCESSEHFKESDGHLVGSAVFKTVVGK